MLRARSGFTGVMSPAALFRSRCWPFPFTKANWDSQLVILDAFSSFTTSHSNTTEHLVNPALSPLGPPPIQLGITHSSGRGVFATRRVGDGDLIHTAKPILSHPSLSAINTTCYLCLRKLKTLNSNNYQAHGVSFCSEECKERSKDFYDVEMRACWMDFDDHCRTQGLKYPFLMKRFACMVIAGAMSPHSLDILQPANLTSEMSIKMEEEFILLRKAFISLNANENIDFLTKQWYISVLARIRRNAFRVEVAGGSYEDLISSAAASVEAEAAVGNAVYMLPSFYNHDCDPNTHIVWIDNADARLKALREVQTGEELRICYIDASMDRNARQKILFEGFGFQCNCNRCLCGD